MVLFIDGQAADTDSLTGVFITISVASVVNPEYGRAGYSKSISIPMTPNNRGLMGDCEQINGRDKFNAQMHDVRVEVDGCVVMDGFIRLVRCEKKDDAGRYVFNIIGTAKKWADYFSTTTISALFPEYSTTISAQQIRDSWSSAVAVRWLPVLRNSYESQGNYEGLTRPERVLSASDYHPFIHCRTLLRRVFSDAGYSLSSDFLDSKYFDSFYLSGRYASSDVQLLKKRMNFKAARFGEASSSADRNGIVYANPNVTYNSIGNIVETANPKEIYEGKSVEGVFDNGGCFMKKAGRIAFVPTSDVEVGFEYKLKYRTDYRIKSRSQLVGFDKVFLGNGQLTQFNIFNSFEDRREQFRAGRQFRCVICDYTAGYTYRLIADKKVGDVIERDCTIAQMTSASMLINVSEVAEYRRLRIMYSDLNLDGYSYFSGEWALYDGYVAERGETEVEITVRGRAEKITPNSPKYFDLLYFAGADSGMKLTLLEAEVRPVFHMQPGEGDTVSFYEIGVYNKSCISVLKALGDMFGLCFYTDELERKVYVEPRAMFYRDDVVVDWSDRVDYSRPVEVGELSAEAPGRVTWRYLSGDRATAEFNRERDDLFGAFSVDSGNPWREWDEKIYENRLFTSTINSVGIYSMAPSASIVHVGDEANVMDDSIEDLNFKPKIVRYLGMKYLPDGERWGWPSFADSYPLMAFHYPRSVEGVVKPTSAAGSAGGGVDEQLMNGYTLCHESRDGVEGLNKWWDGLFEMYRNGVKLTAWLSIAPDEIEAFVRPNYLKHDFRATFRLHIDGEWSDWRLEEIVDYSPCAASTKCVFTKAV